MFTVNVSPDMGMYSLLRSQGYDPAYAIAEFVDNAIHAYLIQCSERIEKGDPLNVELKFYSSDHRGHSELQNCIIIKDDGAGIAGSHLGEALKPAKHSGMQGLSEFGIGMKAAAVWFADTWNLETLPVNESKKYNLTFDLNTLLKVGSDTIEVAEEENIADKKGTTLTLSNLRKAIDSDKFKEICNTLRELYQRFTAGESPRLKLVAFFNDTPTELQFVPPKDRTVLDAPIYKTVAKTLYAIGQSKPWTVPISTVFNGHKVEGFISLLETGSYKTNPGLVLFRNERVICGTTKQPYIPQKLMGTSNKYARQRIYGELHMDDMPVTYTKDKFEIDENAFIEQLNADPAVIELRKQAEEYRSGKNAPEPIKVDAEEDIPGRSSAGNPGNGKNPTPNPSPSPAPAPAPNPNPNPAPTPAPAPAQQPDIVLLLDELKGKTSSLMLRSVIDETRYQIQWRRDVAAALCFRMVLELGVLFRIEKDYPAVYVKVAEKGIKGVLNYMNGNLTTFFDASVDHRVIKCVQSLAVGTQAEVILLNNVSHGHYQPGRAELNRFAVNVEQLLRWAFA